MTGQRDAEYRTIAREVLTDLADALHSGRVEYGPGNASLAVRDWMNERYPQHDRRARFCQGRADGTEWTTGIRCLVCDPVKNSINARA